MHFEGFSATFVNFALVMQVSQNREVAGIGNLQDFEGLFRQHYKNLCTYARLFVQDPDLSEDIVQEVFYKLWKNKEAISIDSSLKSYLFRSVRNGCFNVIEQNRVRDGYKSRQQAEREIDQQQIIDHAIVNELEIKINETIDQLPPERRKIFVMSRFEGLKYREIADELGLSVKTVENQMYHALSFMRVHLKEYLPFVIWIFFNHGNR